MPRCSHTTVGMRWLRQGPLEEKDTTATAQSAGKVSAGLARPSFQPIIKPPNPTQSDIHGEVRVEPWRI